MPGPFNQWLKFFTPRARTEAANSLYLAIVKQSRLPTFYTSCSVEDTVDGRFDMIAIHCFLVMNRLKDRGEKADRLAQVLFDEMFSDMDRGLRELGVGDMGVGKRVRAMAKAYMGRVDVYDEAITASDKVALSEALIRNLYRGADVPPATVSLMASYIMRESDQLAAQADEDVLAGKVHFGPAPTLLAPVEGEL
jgi:cytochrome b pre-mRNA-processing protein 3